MIERKLGPRARRGRGLWAVLAMGALLLPAEAWAQAPAKANPDKKADGGGVRLTLPVQFVAADDPNQAQAELKKLEAELAQKQDEVAKIAAQIEALRAKTVKTASPDKGAVFVWRIEQEGDRAVLKGAPQPPAPGAGGAPAGKPGFVVRLELPDADKRIEDMEAKLKAVLEELEQLRRERKAGAPQSGQEGAGQRFGIIFGEPSAPAKEPAAVQGQLRLILSDLKLQAEKHAPETAAREAEIEARLKAAEAERQAAEAKVKQAEEELRKLKANAGDAPKKP
ncbi:MAG TPA: hypothetical protein VMS17_07580 [Gemmataceae bacterium]|nr:hypothetical protein [Gemmataceae bacterium]